MDHKPLPSTRWLNYARCILDYDPLTGNFTRKEQAHGYGGIKEIGSTAGGDKDGYIKIGIDQVYYSAHVLAYWFIVGQDIPTGTEIDHINRIRNDNRWENLRLVTRSNNNFNSAPGSNNKSGVTGVSWQRDGYWVSRLIKDGVFVLNKVFRTFEEAVEARLVAEKEHYGVTTEDLGIHIPREEPDYDRPRVATRKWSDPELRLDQSRKIKEHLAIPENYKQRVEQLASVSSLGCNAAREVVKGSVWITDGKANRRVASGTLLPEGWWAGRAAGNFGSQPGTVTYSWITDGVTTKRVDKNSQIPPGWRIGRNDLSEELPKRRLVSTKVNGTT